MSSFATGPPLPVRISEYIYCPSTSLSCVTTVYMFYFLAVLYVPVAGTILG